MQYRKCLVTFVTVAAASLAIVNAQSAPSGAAASASSPIVGAWTLNKDLSDLGAGQNRGNGDDRENDDDNAGRGGGRRRGGGGFGGGGFGRGGGGNTQAQDSEAAQRKRTALRDELLAPDHMTIVQLDTTIIITTRDGRTTRLSTDGKKVKDESTGVERKTKWDADKLVTEVTGLGSGKITETYSFDGELKQLRMALAIDGRRKTSLTRVYDLDPK